MSNDDLSTIHVDQYLAHSPAKVWRALTSPELMAQWLMPNDFQPVIGHRFTLWSQPVAQTRFSGEIACEVLAIYPPHVLSISWADAHNQGAKPTTVTWTVQPDGNGTRLLLEHAGFDPDDPIQQLSRRIMNGGWRSHVLARLTAVLDGVNSKGGPMPKSIAEKLQIKPKSSLFLAGDNAELRQLLEPLPDDTTTVKAASAADIAVLFTTDSADLEAKAGAHLGDLTSARATWIAYPKGGRSDINRDSIWRRSEELGWTLNANISLSDTWSAVRIKPQS
ncbi:SRPBCC family protein [Arthrobacter rhombi]|uniref:SRPBCC family protein n=1 Tax=Arthrobacter rhombi TaxID=71253 RepID=UPI003FD4A996